MTPHWNWAAKSTYWWGKRYGRIFRKEWSTTFSLPPSKEIKAEEKASLLAQQSHLSVQACCPNQSWHCHFCSSYAEKAQVLLSCPLILFLYTVPCWTTSLPLSSSQPHTLLLKSHSEIWKSHYLVLPAKETGHQEDIHQCVQIPFCTHNRRK